MTNIDHSIEFEAEPLDTREGELIAAGAEDLLREEAGEKPTVLHESLGRLGVIGGRGSLFANSFLSTPRQKPLK